MVAHVEENRTFRTWDFIEMNLPLEPPYPPMECLAVSAIPDGPNWQYEPKWDGFRCLAFRDEGELYLQSKAGQPLARYFPEVVETLLALKAKKFVLDGELVVPVDGQLSFDHLLQRIHPAASRIAKLSRETPASFLVFDLLVDAHGGKISDVALRERRQALEHFADLYLASAQRLYLSPATARRVDVDRWFAMVGGALDGVIAKRADLGYRSGDRSGAQKIKHLRTADCVIGGFRYSKDKTGVASILLGLYDERGKLNHVGFSSGFQNAERRELLTKLKPLIEAPGFTGSAPGGPSRWKQTEEPWEPLVPAMVVEVRFDHVSGGRFRHGTKVLRWRRDKAPAACTIDQMLAPAAASPLALVSRSHA